MHPCAEYVIIENNIDVLFIAEMATMESTFLYVRKFIDKTLSGALPERVQIKTES